MHTSEIPGVEGKKVAGYARVSTLEQADKGTSIDEQKRLIVEECMHRGWQLTKIYCDEGASGKIIDRPELQNLCQDAQKGSFESIMFTKSDRLTRSIRDLSNLWHDWTAWGLEIICIEQPEISSKGIYGKMLRNLLGIFAEWERDSIIERTTSGRMARWRKCESFMGSLPYGYVFDKTNRKIVLHPEKARICKRIFNMYLNQKLDTRAIALRLSKASVPSPRGKNNWQCAAVNNILKNPAYTGKAEFNMYKFETVISKNNLRYKTRSREKKDKSQWITVEFPSIISKSVHLQVLDRMKSVPSWYHKRGDRRHGKYFILENISLICGECGAKMKIHALERRNQKSIYTYYRCRRNAMSRKTILTMYHDSHRCDMRVDANTLDNFIFGQVMEVLDGIVRMVRCGMAELTFQNFVERLQEEQPEGLVKTLSLNKMGSCKIGAWEMIKCNRGEFDTVRHGHQDHEKHSSTMQNNEGVALRICNQNIKDVSNYYKISSEQMIRKATSCLSTEITSYINRMTFEQKKRVIESIIGAESGGRCTIRWAEPANASDLQKYSSAFAKGRFTSGAFRNIPQLVQITFFADLRKIQDLVWDPDMVCKEHSHQMR